MPPGVVYSFTITEAAGGATALRLGEIKLFDASGIQIHPTSALSSSGAAGTQEATDATALIDGDASTSWVDSSFTGETTISLYLPPGTAVASYQFVTDPGAIASGGNGAGDIDIGQPPTGWTVTTGIAGGIPRDATALGSVSGASPNGMYYTIQPPSPPPPLAFVQIGLLNSNDTFYSSTLPNHNVPFALRLVYAGAQENDVAKWMPLSNGGCAGAAASPLGGPIDAAFTQTVTLPAGEYALCLAREWWLARRGRSMQQLLDSHFEWIPEVRLLAAFEPPSSPYPPASPPPLFPLYQPNATGEESLTAEEDEPEPSSQGYLWRLEIVIALCSVLLCCCCWLLFLFCYCRRHKDRYEVRRQKRTLLDRCCFEDDDTYPTLEKTKESASPNASIEEGGTRPRVGSSSSSSRALTSEEDDAIESAAVEGAGLTMADVDLAFARMSQKVAEENIEEGGATRMPIPVPVPPTQVRVSIDEGAGAVGPSRSQSSATLPPVLLTGMTEFELSDSEDSTTGSPLGLREVAGTMDRVGSMKV